MAFLYGGVTGLAAATGAERAVAVHRGGSPHSQYARPAGGPSTCSADSRRTAHRASPRRSGPSTGAPGKYQMKEEA
jgi:hypothetical protein